MQDVESLTARVRAYEQEKQTKLEQRREEAHAQELAECVFTPQVRKTRQAPQV